jgi:hypothetical protein
MCTSQATTGQSKNNLKGLEPCDVSLYKQKAEKSGTKILYCPGEFTWNTGFWVSLGTFAFDDIFSGGAIFCRSTGKGLSTQTKWFQFRSASGRQLSQENSHQ